MNSDSSHVMVDVECLSLKPHAVLLSLGAVRFDPTAYDEWSTLDYLSRTFYTAFSMDLQIQAGGHICADTLGWWMQQSPDAQSVFEDSNAMPIHSTPEALDNFREFVGECAGLWASPSHFDYPKLLWLYEANRMPFPVEYYKIHCAMTLKAVVDPTGENTKIHTMPGFVAHNALEDAKKQVLQVQQCLRLLKS